MAQYGDGAPASQDFEAPLIEHKRKFDEMVNRNRGGGKAGLPAAPVPSFNNARPPLTEFDPAKQSIADIVASSFAKFQRLRTEEAAEEQSDPVRSDGLDLGAAFADDNFKCVHSQPAKGTLPMHHQQFHHGAQQFHHGAQCSNRGGFNQSGNVDVPNLKAVAGSAGVLDFALRTSGDKFTVSIDSGEVSRFVNQFPTRTFAIKANSQSIEIILEPGAE